jgi:hypothetical protein
MAACLLACNDTDTGSGKEVTDNAEKTVTRTADSLQYNQQKDSAIYFQFAKDSVSLTAKGFMRSSKEPIIGYLAVHRKAELNAQLVPLEKDMNIRFTQLILPDSTMDGPFGQQFRYKLVQKGMYKIIISANLMASGKTKGDFLVRIRVID